MAFAHPSPPVNEQTLWRESVLSTRSLSYMSVAGSPGVGAPLSQSTSLNYPRPPTQRSTNSDLDLEMADVRDRELKDIPELPDSVAECPLFTLPREIRDRIYSFCLDSPYGWPIDWPRQCKIYGLQPQLLRTCRIIHNEAAPLLYVLSYMNFHHPSDANMFSRAMSSPTLSKHVARVGIHIRAQDTRLWMPYIMSKDSHRSLRMDFPNIRELNVRFRSARWQHALPPEANMKIWSEDTRLDELMDGLRLMFLPDTFEGSKSEGEPESYFSHSSSAYSLNPGDPSYTRQWLEIHKARSEFTAKRAVIPKIKVVCACRVHGTHFNALTMPAAPMPDLSQPGNVTGVIQQTTDRPAVLVREGEPFRGFTAIDLQQTVQNFYDPEIGSANVARTCLADKNGILLGLEIHCLDPKRDAPGPV